MNIVMNTEAANKAAVNTLTKLGYTYHDGELWKPPIGQVPDFTKLPVSIDALRMVLSALIGPAHMIRELQVFMNSPMFNNEKVLDNPIKLLVDQYNEFVELQREYRENKEETANESN